MQKQWDHERYFGSVFASMLTLFEICGATVGVFLDPFCLSGLLCYYRDLMRCQDLLEITSKK